MGLRGREKSRKKGMQEEREHEGCKNWLREWKEGVRGTRFFFHSYNVFLMRKKWYFPF